MSATFCFYIIQRLCDLGCDVCCVGVRLQTTLGAHDELFARTAAAVVCAIQLLDCAASHFFHFRWRWDDLLWQLLHTREGLRECGGGTHSKPLLEACLVLGCRALAIVEFHTL